MGSNTSIGIANGIGFKSRSTGIIKKPLPPHIKDNLVGVWECYGKKNEGADRATIKNKIRNRGGDLLCSNFSYSENSGYGGNSIDFSNPDTIINPSYARKISNIKVEVFENRSAVQIHFSNTTTFKNKIKITGLDKNAGRPVSLRIYSNAPSELNSVSIIKDGEYDVDFIASEGANRTYLYVTGIVGVLLNPVTIELLPDFPGALVTDGVNDFIKSEKTVVDMLEGSSEITVVSMIQGIKYASSIGNRFYVNSIRDVKVSRNDISSIDKLGVYGYTILDLSSNNVTTINNIIGDKNDIISIRVEAAYEDGRFYPATLNKNNVNSVAYYWTFIAKAVLTTDEINQIIAYYDLDKCVSPIIYYDIKKQGLSNNTPDADWYLKDFSGNGRDAKLYNYGKSLDSGIGKYALDFLRLQSNIPEIERTSSKVTGNNKLNTPSALLYFYITIGNTLPSIKLKVKVSNLIGQAYYKFFDSSGASASITLSENKEYELPENYVSNASEINWYGFGLRPNSSCTIEQIPEYPNALISDGVDDYAQYVGDLGLKDYTIVADRAYGKFINSQGVPIVSDTITTTDTPFLFEFGNIRTFSFNADTILTTGSLNHDRIISYQTTYKYLKNSISKGKSTKTGNGLTLSRYGGDTQYAPLYLYSLLLFPYSLSEFLIERQLKKHKLNPLHPETKNK